VCSANGGQTGVQTIFGFDSHGINVFGVHSKSEFSKVLMDFLIKRRAPQTLISESANEKTAPKQKSFAACFK